MKNLGLKRRHSLHKGVKTVKLGMKIWLGSLSHILYRNKKS